VVLASRLKSPLEVFTGIHQSNNNHLNTLLIYSLDGPANFVTDHIPLILGITTVPASFVIYRLPPVILGIATVLVAGHIGWRRGRIEAVLAIILTAFSYLLIHYSSEARGYGYAIFFDLLAFDFLEQYLTSKSVWSAAGFWASCTFSLLSHLMFLMVYAAFVTWSVIRLAREGRGWRDTLAKVVLCHAVPVAAIGLLYAVDIRHMTVGGAPDYSLINVVTETLALTVGGPQYGTMAVVVAIISAGLAAAGLKLLWTEKSTDWIFYLTVLILAPVLFVAIGKPEFLAIRYFLGSVVFFLILLSRLLAEFFRGPVGHKVLAGFLVMLFLAGNGWHTARLLRLGRGDYLAAVRYMAENTPGDTVDVSSDHDFRNGGMVSFYAKYVPGKRIRYSNGSEFGATPWKILHRQDKDDAPGEWIKDGMGNTYRLAREYSYAGLSGYRWFVYRRHSRVVE
jgi:hypothetical protein